MSSSSLLVDEEGSTSEGHQTEEELDVAGGSSIEGSKSSSGGGGSGGGTDDSSRKRLFSKELRHMMFGLGDDQNPYTESVDLIEDLVIEYIAEMTQKAMEIGRSGRVQVEDILHIVRKDARKYARVKDLLNMNEELKKARKAFDEVKYAGV